MGQMLLILLRILFPLDPVARYRELMRNWLGMVMSWVADPEELEAYAYWTEDRAKLESCICFLEYAMQVLIHDRTRQMLGLRYVYSPLQDKPHIRHPKSLNQLLKRLAQLARDFHNLDVLASRRADRMRRERGNDPLRLAAAPQSTSPSLRLVEVDRRAFAPRRRGRRIPARTSLTSRDCRLPIASHASARERPCMPATSRNLRHISPAPLRAPKNELKPNLMIIRAKILRLKQAIKRLAPARHD